MVRQKKRLGQMIMMGSTVVLLIYVSAIGVSNYFRYNKFKLEYEHQMEKYKDLKAKNQAYRIQVQKFNSLDFWELEAKTRLGYCKEGELQFEVVQNPGVRNR